MKDLDLHCGFCGEVLPEGLSFVDTSGIDTWEPGMMMWFGPCWHAPINHFLRLSKTPVGELCLICDFEIKENDQGELVSSSDGYKPMHLSCVRNSIQKDLLHI